MGTMHYFLFGVILMYAFCRSTAGNADQNECSFGPCKNNGSCEIIANEYNCSCQPGYTGSNCETDINECSSEPCKNDGYCKDNVNGFNCTCQPGFTGSNCETDINECDSEPCKNGGQCADIVNGYTCTCQQGYEGSNCEIDINECDSEPCKNDGSCSNKVNGYTCSCQQGYTGINCETDINECVSGPCKNGGVCADKVNGYTCTCQKGYTGTNCNTDINECASGPCKNGGSCADLVNGYTCTCHNGYTGINCAIDINECALEPCKNGGSCEDNVNGYTCTCQNGYTGINCETDINECASEPCKNGGSCEDNVNGYKCTCQNGYTGINCETDINECASEPCKNRGSCEDNVNRYTCTCQNGYTGINCETDINECAKAPCKNGGSCEDNVNGYTCTCQNGYTGINCDADIDECASGPCKNGGSCADKVNKYTCSCRQGFAGINCETDVNECASEPCKNGGSCEDNVNGYTCTCINGYTGANCETDINECASRPCKNGGSCKDKVNGYTCSCQNGYEGINCETDINECATRPCKHGGSCADKVNGYICTCQKGYTGISCETDINECAKAPCKNGGSCEDNVNGYTCTCQNGYTGINCETDINECASGPCKNGGSCSDNVNGYTCTCQQGYEGINCETGLQCDPIGELYGGQALYDSDSTEVGTSAYFECDDDFSLYPPDVDTSLCLANRTWFPEPPKCYKKAHAECPDNSDCHGSFLLQHNQTKTIRCDRDYELYDVGNKEFLDKMEIQITNNNGTLKPGVPNCVEKRCFSTILTHAVIKYANGSHADLKVLSGGERLDVSCADGYELDSERYRRLHKLSESVCCRKGKFYKNCKEDKEVTQCIEKSCPFDGYPSNMRTKRQRAGEFSRFLADDEYIEHGETIEYSCQNDEYELYVKETNKYLTEFSETCQYGNFSRPKQEFPLCQERGCEFPIFERDKNVCYLVSNTSSACSNDSFKTASRSSFNLTCNEGYELYDNTNRTYTGEEWATLTCVKGKPTPEYLCKPKRCLLPSMPSNATTRMSRPIPSINSSHVESGKSVEFSCKGEDFELFVESTNTYLPNFQSTCLEGNFDKTLTEFPYCIEKRCVFQPIPGVKYYTNDKENPESNGTFTVESRSRINITCNPGFKLFSKRTTKDSREETATVGCIKGKLEEDVTCLPEKLWPMFYTQVKVLFYRYEETMSKLGCRFSLLSSQPCADSCFVPEIQHGWTKLKSSSYAVRRDVNHETKVQMKCDEDYQLVGSEELQCINGSWNNELPVCWYKPCEFEFVQGQLVLDKNNNFFTPLGKPMKFPNGTRLNIMCRSGYSLNIVTAGVQQEKRNFTRVTTVCQSGSWMPLYTCIPKSCPFEGYPNNVHTKRQRKEEFSMFLVDDEYIYHGETIEYSCQNEEYELYVKETDEYLTEFSETCQYGNFSRSKQEFPVCQERGCEFPFSERDKNVCYLVSNSSSTCSNDTFKTASRSSFNLKCNEGYELYQNTDQTYTVEEWSTLTCVKGKATPEYFCKPKPCEINFVQGQLVFNEINNIISTPGLQKTFKDGTKLHIKCVPGYSLFFQENEPLEETGVSVSSICQTGSWKPVYQCFQDCKLSTDVSFLYKNVDGDIIDPGSSIKHGTRLEVFCRYVDLGDYTYDDEADNDVPQVECSNGALGQINIKCKEGDPETCTTLPNGSVKRRFLNEYKVSCNEGYALNLMRPDIPYCECRDNRLVCHYGGQTPKCVPEPCTIPYSYDNRLSIFIRRGGNVVSLSGGVTVNVGDTLFFNCINTEFENYEPNNRRFKCKNGKWQEDEKDKEWKLGYDGEFPLCRNTSCEPMCKNGGKCIRDDMCQCPHLTSGASCEIVLCDAECTKNGGTCIAPGKCGNCPPRAYGNNCEHRECTLLADGPKVKKNSSYQLGDKILSSEISCSEGYIATPEIGITCLEGGKWSDTPKCISGCRPPVGIPEVKNSNKTFYHEGDKIDSSNLFCPRGHVLFPKDDIKCLNGGKWTETSKCQRGCFPPDVTPPLKTHKEFYQTGEVIDTYDFRCSPGYFATPKNGMRCLESGRWYPNITCIRGCTLPPDLPQLRQQDKMLYVIGERISSSEFICNTPSVLSSTNDMTCMEGGQWNEIVKCNSRCTHPVSEHPTQSRKPFYNTGETIASSEFSCGSRSFARPENGMTCMEGGKWTETVKCIEDENGCELSSNRSFLFQTSSNDVVDPGSFIANGTTLKILCRNPEPVNDYDYYSEAIVTENVQYVECVNGQLGQTTIKCKQVKEDPDSCTKLENGSVEKRQIGDYKVSCNEGFALNLMRPETPYCECVNDSLVCQYGKQKPQCEPESCKIPYSFDNRLTISQRKGTSVFNLSGGVSVQTGETVYFDCINTEFNNFEPNNRRFNCTNGKWLEDDIDEQNKTWTLGNQGALPICRNTSCSPMCEHGGKCIRDDTCQCTELRRGRRCEEAICDQECTNNGGKCVAPGQCEECPKGSFGNNCQYHNPDGCFKYIPTIYPFDRNVIRDDQIFIGADISMTETKCKMECLKRKDKTCKSVYHQKIFNKHHILQYYVCWGFEEDKRDSHFYRKDARLLVRYFERIC